MAQFTVNELSSQAPFADRPIRRRIPTSVWIIVGYSFWFGFFLGALIMHSIIKSV